MRLPRPSLPDGSLKVAGIVGAIGVLIVIAAITKEVPLLDGLEFLPLGRRGERDDDEPPSDPPDDPGVLYVDE